MIQTPFFTANQKIVDRIVRNWQPILIGNGHIFRQCHQNVRTHCFCLCMWSVRGKRCKFQIRNYLIEVSEWKKKSTIFFEKSLGFWLKWKPVKFNKLQNLKDKHELNSHDKLKKQKISLRQKTVSRSYRSVCRWEKKNNEIVSLWIEI